MDDQERLADARRRLQAMIDDPFGGQVLRDLVPRGRVITIALATEGCDAALRRAIADSGGLPAFLAVDEGVDALTLLIVRHLRRGVVGIRRPGDWSTPLWSSAEPSETLGELIAVLRASNERQGNDE